MTSFVNLALTFFEIAGFIFTYIFIIIGQQHFLVDLKASLLLSTMHGFRVSPPKPPPPLMFTKHSPCRQHSYQLNQFQTAPRTAPELNKVNHCKRLDSSFIAQMSSDIIQLAQQTRVSSQILANTPLSTRRELIISIADALVANQDKILAENRKDIDLAQANQISAQLVARLKLSPEKLRGLSTGLHQLATLDDPLNNVMKTSLIAEGLKLEQKTVPIGVILIIFESRPDALVQIATLTLYSGNGVILKGGSEAQYSNTILHQIIQQCIVDTLQKKHTLPELHESVVSLVHFRNEISELLQMDKYIDLVIPRGSNQLVSYIQKNTQIPVMGHSEGVCHIYVDNENTNWKKVSKVLIDAKCDYPSACNALEMIVLHSYLFQRDNQHNTIPAVEFLNDLKSACVELFFTQELCTFIQSHDKGICKESDMLSELLPAWQLCTDIHKEYGDLQCSVHIVDSIDSAIKFINSNSSHHTESILTDNKDKMVQFTNYIDSASVFVNASTRFADGFRYGLGAEIGISTSRIHARGPVGLEGLVTYKWIMVSDQDLPVQSALDPSITLPPGHTVGEFGKKERVYLHKKL